MSGHNKWSTIKHKKGAADAKRGKVFTKLIKELTVAARQGGGDPDGNPRLRIAVNHARQENMPKDNIDRAIKRGTGEIEGMEYVECLFEGYGPGGVAILVEAMTDNNNRTSADIRAIFNKNNGSLGAQGSVAWMFERKGMILIQKEAAPEDKILDIGLSSGAEDVKDLEEIWEVITAPHDFETVRNAFEAAKIAMASAELSMVAKTTVTLQGDDAQKVLKLVERLDECDDVQKVHGNYEIPSEVLEKMA